MNQILLLIPQKICGKVRQICSIHKLRKEYRNIFCKNPNTVFLVMTPEHGNLGDHAIAQAEINMLKNAGFHYIEISGKQLEQMRWDGLLGALDGWPIMVNGGGNLGTLWYGVEDIFRKLISQTPHSSILLFPNTIYYEDSDWGKEEFEKSKRIYNRHKQLRLYAREKRSYDVMSTAYRNVTLIPDVVLSLNECKNDKGRYGCLLCLRRDCEKTRTEEQEQIIRQQAAELFGDMVNDSDMVLPHRVAAEQREQVLRAKFDQFSSAELVITDRLHGMIFCAITGTPCIVVDSKSPKVRGCYEWIKHLDYIRFADDVSCIALEYERIPRKEHHYDNSHMRPYFDELVKVVKEYAHN